MNHRERREWAENLTYTVQNENTDECYSFCNFISSRRSYAIIAVCLSVSRVVRHWPWPWPWPWDFWPWPWLRSKL